MSKTKPNLLHSIRNESRSQPREATVPAEPSPPVRSGASARTTLIGGHFAPQVKSSFRMIQEKHPEKTMRQLIVEAFNLLFERYKVPPSAW
jgi:hypothetical protein